MTIFWRNSMVHEGEPDRDTKEGPTDELERARSARGQAPDAQPRRPRHHDLFAIRTGSVTVHVTENDAENSAARVVLSLQSDLSGRSFTVLLTTLELDLLAYGLNRVAVKLQHDAERR